MNCSRKFVFVAGIAGIALFSGACAVEVISPDGFDVRVSLDECLSCYPECSVDPGTYEGSPGIVTMSCVNAAGASCEACLVGCLVSNGPAACRVDEEFGDHPSCQNLFAGELLDFPVVCVSPERPDVF